MVSDDPNWSVQLVRDDLHQCYVRRQERKFTGRTDVGRIKFGILESHWCRVR